MKIMTEGRVVPLTIARAIAANPENLGKLLPDVRDALLVDLKSADKAGPEDDQPAPSLPSSEDCALEGEMPTRPSLESPFADSGNPIFQSELYCPDPNDLHQPQKVDLGGQISPIQPGHLSKLNPRAPQSKGAQIVQPTQTATGSRFPAALPSSAAREEKVILRENAPHYFGSNEDLEARKQPFATSRITSSSRYPRAGARGT